MRLVSLAVIALLGLSLQARAENVHSFVMSTEQDAVVTRVSADGNVMQVQQPTGQWVTADAAVSNDISPAVATDSDAATELVKVSWYGGDGQMYWGHHWHHHWHHWDGGDGWHYHYWHRNYWHRHWWHHGWWRHHGW